MWWVVGYYPGFPPEQQTVRPQVVDDHNLRTNLQFCCYERTPIWRKAVVFPVELGPFRVPHFVAYNWTRAYVPFQQEAIHRQPYAGKHTSRQCAFNA